MARFFPFPRSKASLAFVAAALLALGGGYQLVASEGEKPQNPDYEDVFAAPAPFEQTQAEANAKSLGCKTCHSASDEADMHTSPAVMLGCTDCHGGNANVELTDDRLKPRDPSYVALLRKAHVLPRYPQTWNWPSSANPKHAFTLLNKESPEFIRFVNPSDYRVARESCGACHLSIIEAAERSIMSTGAMLWGGAGYNNGIVPLKNYALGEAYTRTGEPACVISPGDRTVADDAKKSFLSPCPPAKLSPAELAKGAQPILYPLPTWHTIKPGDIFRVFERGGRTINTQFAEVGLPNPSGSIQRLEEPGRPDLKQSNRGPATGLRVAIPVINIHKTRLNDPFMWFMGTNDQPGDYRSSGCAGCHVVYANDREPRHSLTYAPFGRDGQTATKDPTIAALKEGDRPDPHGEEHGKDHEDGKAAHGDEHGSAPSDSEGHNADDGKLTFAEGHDDRPEERGHPIKHAFTKAIPTAQCMNCHMHQPNIFLNSYLGYTMWDYESDAPFLWPGPENKAPKPSWMSQEQYEKTFKHQRYPTAAEVRKTNERNPEAAAARGLWSDVEMLRHVYDLNPALKDTQFADYHGHGWNFRAILKRDREGNLLDAKGDVANPDPKNVVDPNDPQKWRKDCSEYLPDEPEKHDLCMRTGDNGKEGKFVPAGLNPGKSVHMMDIHAEKGLQCADCHFSQDSHGNGYIYTEVANAVEIGCKDCHGTVDDYPNLMTSGPAARPSGTNLALLRNADGKRRFEWFYDGSGNRVLIQRSIVDPNLEWRVSLVKDSVDRSNPKFNMKAARAKLVGVQGTKINWGPGIAKADRAHGDDKMTCFTCHLSWSTSCGGCHLPIEANWKTKRNHYDDKETRNFATYNPQVARDDMFHLGRHGFAKPGEPDADGNARGIIVPVRSTSALVLSSTNVNRERIYIQQPPISAGGYSSQAFAPHFPHTVRTTETKTCSDCHVSDKDDNNAIMAQTLLLGTNYVNFLGLHAWTGLEGGIQATRVTEWEEPQAVIGSYLHRYAYPDWYKLHVDQNKRELINWTRGKIFNEKLSGETQHTEQFYKITQNTSGAAQCIQLRGEYLFVAEGKGGFRAYDVASIANKGFSERIIRAPFSPLGQDTQVDSPNATCVALATTQPISVKRNDDMSKMMVAPDTSLLQANKEQRMHDIYRYAVVSDSVEGLILVDIDTLADGEFRNNFFKRAVTFNPDGVLKGARHVTLAGSIAYVTTDYGLAVVDLTDPLKPVLTASLPLKDARASAVQFRYLWVTDAEGLKLFDITDLRAPIAKPDATVPMANARKIYLARTYAYVAAKAEGLVIVNIKKPESPVVYARETFGGQLNDAEDVVVASTNASAFAYVADGRNGLKVLQITSPGSQPNFYGFAPAPKPELIAWATTPSPALSVSKGLDRDRAVDETGGQMAVFGRVGSRPFTRPEMERLFKLKDGSLFKVSDTPSWSDYVAVQSARR
jgi:hypothetical protein